MPINIFIWRALNIPFNAEALLKIISRSFLIIELILFDDMAHDLVFVLHLTRLLKKRFCVINMVYSSNDTIAHQLFYGAIDCIN